MSIPGDKLFAVVGVYYELPNEDIKVGIQLFSTRELAEKASVESKWLNKIIDLTVDE